MSLAKQYSRHKGMIRAILFIAGLLFVLMMAKESWANIAGLLDQLRPVEFLLSVFIAVFGNVVSALLFNRLLGKHGVSVPDALAIKMHLVGQVAKYIPGKIWGMAYQISHVVGVAGAKGVVLANLEMMLGVIWMTGIVAAVLLCLFVSKLAALLILLLGMLGFLLLYRKNIVNQVVRFLPGRLKSIELLKETAGRPTTLFAGSLFYLIFCSVYVFSYALMLESVFGFPFDEAVVYIALLAAAWIGGVFAFIVPAGMGVRELIFVSVSSYALPQHSIEVLISIAVLARFWQIFQDLIGVSLLLFLRVKVPEP